MHLIKESNIIIIKFYKIFVKIIKVYKKGFKIVYFLYSYEVQTYIKYRPLVFFQIFTLKISKNFLHKNILMCTHHTSIDIILVPGMIRIIYLDIGGVES